MLKDSQIIITLDGPAGSGKSTIARILSQKLGIEYIDSGAIYRALTLYAIEKFDCVVEGRESEVATYFSENEDQLNIRWENHHQKVFLQGKDVSNDIRTPEVTRNIKYIANNNACRQFVNKLMRNLAQKYSFVIDGRDIGTVVFPNAKHKFYLEATPEIRAKRRAIDFGLPQEGEAFTNLCQEINQRDEQDKNRSIAPLKKADDAKLVDTSTMSIEQVVTTITQYVQD